MDNQKLQTKMNVKPFNGDSKDFPKWEMDVEAVLELEELSEVLKMDFLQRLPPRNQVLDPNNPDHQDWIRAKRMNAKCYALSTTMVEGDRLISEFARLKQIYSADNVPKAA